MTPCMALAGDSQLSKYLLKRDQIRSETDPFIAHAETLVNRGPTLQFVNVC